ncbi:MAG: DISARM system phospholipase D-like protein DrmC [Bacteroidota bacterium]
MTDEHLEIVAAAARLADQLPYPVMISIADAIVKHGTLRYEEARHAILQSVPTADFREIVNDFLHQWHTRAQNVGPEAIAFTLVTAAQSERNHRNEQRVEGVWTGPDSPEVRFRQTEQAILEVVETAKHRLTVVSYAVYRIPRIQNALVAAAGRGVSIRCIVETPNRIEGKGAYDCLRALGNDVGEVSSVYYWPQENRARDENGKQGILHVKCAIADGYRLFLSSANLTEYAFTINMELGILVTGGTLPGEIEEHFDRLVGNGVLVGVSS